MLAIPAIDLREGHVVQLVGGDYAAERVRLADPPSVARRWASAGFQRLHLVDLDAATGRGENSAVTASLLRDAGVAWQVGGGVRDREAIAARLAGGATWVVVGTRAIEDPAWLAACASEFPRRIIVAADVRGRDVVTRGWTREHPLDVADAVAALRGIPLGGLLVTAVHCEGRLQGTDLPLMAGVAAASPWPVLASGGITTLADLRALAAGGVAGAVLGMALYDGHLDPRVVAEEFGQ